MNDEEDNDTTEAPETEAVQQPVTPAVAEESIDEKDEINRLLGEGYSVKQIIDLGFKRRTAYHYAKKRVKPENEPTSGSDTTTAGQMSKGKYDMMKLGSKDVIPPEAVLDVLRLPQNGDSVEVWRRGVLDGVGILLLKGKPIYTPEEHVERVAWFLSRMPYKLVKCRYHSFQRYFHWLKQLGWVEYTGKEETSSVQEAMPNYPEAPPRRYYRLTSEGIQAPDRQWSNPQLTLYPERGLDYFREKRREHKYARKAPTKSRRSSSSQGTP